jgi:hypothetical protein
MTLELCEADPTSAVEEAVSALVAATLRSRPLVAKGAQFNGERLTDGMTRRSPMDDASTGVKETDLALASGTSRRGAHSKKRSHTGENAPADGTIPGLPEAGASAGPYASEWLRPSASE